MTSQNWYPLFVRNTGECGSVVEEMIRDNYVDETLEDIINDAFTWASTPEGDSFWRSINRQFQRWCTENVPTFTL